jgi:putative SOS response-associated peptidase YedK
VEVGIRGSPLPDPGRIVLRMAVGEWLWIAGIWERDEERGNCFSMITTEPNEVLRPVHDRMPAVLAGSQIPPYLKADCPSLDLLRFPWCSRKRQIS